MSLPVEASVVVSESVVTIRRKGSSTSIVAQILGKTGSGSSEAIYLDRLVHTPREDELGPYNVSGAVSSILVLKNQNH